MNPEQPGSNPYDFILSNPNGTAPKAYLPKTKSKNGRILVVAGLVFVLLMGFFIVSSLLSKPDPNIADLLSLAQTQHEITRIADAGLQKLGNQNLRYSTITADFTCLSHQNKTVAYLTSQHTKVSIAQLGLKKNSSVDTQLSTASQNSTYDVVFGQIMQRQLLNYVNELKTDYPKLTGAKARALLSQEFLDAQKLVTQLNASIASQTQ